MGEMTVDDGGGRQKTVKVDYPANSKKAKEERVPLEKVIQGEATQRKPSGFGGIARTFLSDDAGTVWQYVLLEVLVPAFKNMLTDAVSQGAERALFGNDRPSRQSRPGYTNYAARFGTGARPVPGSVINDPRPSMSREARATHNFNEILLETRGEAEDVIDALRECISQYQVATVADLYDLVGQSGAFTDNKWGWYDLRSASIRRIRDGWLLDLPRTVSIT
jgi:hypothetical protein